MAKKKESTMQWKVDIADLKKSMKEAKTSLSLANAEFKAATAGMKNWKSSADGVEAKLKQLKSTLEFQNKTLENLNKQYEITAKELGADSEEARKLEIQIMNQKAAITKTTVDIAKYNDNLNQLQKEEEEAQTELGKLTKKIDEQEKELESLRKEYKNAVLTYGENSSQAKKLASQIENLSGELNENKKRMNDADIAAEDLGEELEEVKKSAEKTSNEGFTVMKGALANLVSAGITAAINAFKELGRSMKEALTEAAAYADEISSQSIITGLSTDALQEYNYMADLVDVSVDTLTGSLAKLTKNMANAKNGSKTTTAAFEALGVKITDNTGHLRDNEDVFADVIDALGKIENETERDAASMSIFGKSAQDLNPLIAAGGARIAELAEEAHKMGAVLDEDALNSLNDLQDNLDRLSQATKAAKNNIASNLAPVASEVLEPLTAAFGELPDALASGDFSKVEQNLGKVGKIVLDLIKKLGPKIYDAIKTIRAGIRKKILEAIPEIPGIIKNFLDKIAEEAPKFIQSGVESLKSFISGITSTIPALVAEIPGIIQSFSETVMTLLPEIITAGTEILNALIDGVISMIPSLADTIPQIVETVVTVITENLPIILRAGITLFMQVVDAIPKIIGPLADALPTVITKIVNVLAQNMPKILEAGISLLMEIVNAIPTIVTKLAPEIPTIIGTINTTLIENLPTIFDTALELFGQIIAAIPEFLLDLASNIPQIIGCIVDGLLEGLADIAEVGKRIVEGIWEGIKGAADWLKQKMSDFGNSILDGLMDLYGIASPSKVFRDKIGKNLALGIGVGFTDEMKNVGNNIQKSMGGLVGALNSEINLKASGSGAGSIGTAMGAGQAYNFTQIINSPKAVDRLTLYRQTNSLLFTAQVRAQNA